MTTELLFRADAYQTSATALVTAVNGHFIELDRTIFYPTGGGQPGDIGTLVHADNRRTAIIDTRKGESPDTVLHVAAPDSPLPAVGASMALEIDWPRRHRLMRLHTALHVDFDVDLSLLDAAHIEREVNAITARAIETETVWITDEELEARPELVKTMSVQPPRGAGRVRLLRIPGVDLQPCGGTHVRNLAEIGPIRVIRIRNEGKRNKRVEITFAG